MRPTKIFQAYEVASTTHGHAWRHTLTYRHRLLKQVLANLGYYWKGMKIDKKPCAVDPRIMDYHKVNITIKITSNSFNAYRRLRSPTRHSPRARTDQQLQLPPAHNLHSLETQKLQGLF